MTYSYDIILVCVSVLVAIAGAYACFDLVIRVQRTTGPKRRSWLTLGALAIGGSIWAMHFIAMLAVKLPSVMQYDILITLVSGLVSILMTAVALAIVSFDKPTFKRICVGGTVMGAGITAMHYVGMSGMRGNFSVSYANDWLIISILVGVFASILSLWLVMGLQLRGVLRRLSSALVMGLSIAGVHYSGMYGTSFEPIAHAIEFTQPILSPFSLGLITALVTFGILGWVVLMFLPNSSAEVDQRLLSNELDKNTNPAVVANGSDTPLSEHLMESNAVQEKSDATTDSPATPESTHSTPISTRIPIQRNMKTYFLASSEVASISADGHYSTVRTQDGQTHFCNIGFNKLLNDHHLPELFRVHRSHAININYVVSFQRKRDNATVSLGDDEHEVPVSRSHIAALQDALGLAR